MALPHNLVGEVPDREEYDYRRANCHPRGSGCIVFFRRTSYDVPWEKLALSEQ